MENPMKEAHASCPENPCPVIGRPAGPVRAHLVRLEVASQTGGLGSRVQLGPRPCYLSSNGKIAKAPKPPVEIAAGVQSLRYGVPLVAVAISPKSHSCWWSCRF
jgi:hypothetical protein